MRRRLQLLQWLFLSVGLVLIAIFLLARGHGSWGSRSEIEEFERTKRAYQQASSEGTTADPRAEPVSSPVPGLSMGLPVDDSLWAEGRVEKFRESLKLEFDPPMAILRIPKIALEVPVLDGTDELTLNRAVGRIAGTARINDMGNLGIAGHRDGFFRGLKDIRLGDSLELETLTAREIYIIDDIRIVLPEQVEVLAPTAEPTITLVTCYPFYFVGKAPKRYIVRATRAGPA
jgi:sortase A